MVYGQLCRQINFVLDICRFNLFIYLHVYLGESEDEPLKPLAHHVVHIGIGGLRPDCIYDAPGGAPNLRKRMAEQVCLSSTTIIIEVNKSNAVFQKKENDDSFIRFSLIFFRERTHW